MLDNINQIRAQYEGIPPASRTHEQLVGFLLALLFIIAERVDRKASKLRDGLFGQLKSKTPVETATETKEPPISPELAAIRNEFDREAGSYPTKEQSVETAVKLAFFIARHV